mgnify:CR=1 FL=1
MENILMIGAIFLLVFLSHLCIAFVSAALVSEGRAGIFRALILLGVYAIGTVLAMFFVSYFSYFLLRGIHSMYHSYIDPLFGIQMYAVGLYIFISAPLGVLLSLYLVYRNDRKQKIVEVMK